MWCRGAVGNAPLDCELQGDLSEEVTFKLRHEEEEQAKHAPGNG